MSKPPITVSLSWLGDLKFAVASDRASMTLDSAGTAGPSPVETLGAALAGCMTSDLVFILTRGRHSLRAVRAQLTAERAQDDPRRLLRVALHLTVEGDAPPEAIERAIALSREKYCSVWHSMRQDIDFRVTFDALA